MRVILQRVKTASVEVEGVIKGEIASGLLALVAIMDTDTEHEIKWMAEKITELRIFSDENGKMNRSLIDTGGELLLVSQFTLAADIKKGRRPSFVKAATPSVAIPMLEKLKTLIEAKGVSVAEGEFGAHMEVALVNDGPVTIPLFRDAESSNL